MFGGFGAGMFFVSQIITFLEVRRRIRVILHFA